MTPQCIDTPGPLGETRVNVADRFSRCIPIHLGIFGGVHEYTYRLSLEPYSVVQKGLPSSVRDSFSHSFTVHPQALSGSNGIVTDQTGAAVSDVKVKATNVGTGVKSYAVTSSADTYTVTDLNPGTYAVLIEQTGFQSAMLNNIVVGPGGRRSTADAVLRTGSLSERVEIVAQSITLETSQPDLGATVEHKVVGELPMFIGGRNGGVAAGAVGKQIDDYLFLVPGVQGGEFADFRTLTCKSCCAQGCEGILEHPQGAQGECLDTEKYLERGGPGSIGPRRQFRGSIFCVEKNFRTACEASAH